MSIAEFSWLATGLVLLAGWGRRARLAGPVAWTAIAMFVASTFLANMYRTFGWDLDSAVKLWQIHIAALVCLYGMLAIYLNQRYRSIDTLPILGITILGTAAVILASQTPEPVRAQKALEFFAMGCVPILGIFCILAVPRRDTIGLALMCVLVAGEGLAALTYLECQIVYTWDAPRGTTSACSRLFGSSLQYIESSIMAPAWFYIIYRWLKPRTG